MNYDDLNPEQQGVVDAVMDDCGSIERLGEKFSCSRMAMRKRLHYIYRNYGISSKPFLPMIRLAYLRSRELGLLCLILCVLAGVGRAQAATRPIILIWGPSPSSSVTGYSLYVCTSTTSTPCVPSTTGAPSLTFTSTATTGVYTGTVGLFYSFVLVANAPACSGTSPIGQACGNSLSVTVNPNPVPVPPQVSGATTPTSSVP